MSKFSNHIQIILKHWPKRETENSPIIRQLAEITAQSSCTEEDIERFCQLLSDEFDRSFNNGLNASNL
jgi:hypothetical protein